MLPSSTDFYKTIETATGLAAQQITDATGLHPKIVIWCSGYQKGLEIQIAGDYNSNTEVKGRDLWGCVDEFIRRFQFEQNQKSLLLSGPVIENGEDEI